MKKFKILFYNIFFFLIFFLLFDVIVSNYFLKIDYKVCYKIEKNFYELEKNCSGNQRFKPSLPVNKVKTDNYGARTSKTKNTSEEKQKILIFGDSMTFGVGIEYENTYVGLLEKKFPAYNFYNFAVGSYSPSMHLYKLEKAIENKLIPKKIILFLDLSDVFDEGQRWQVKEGSSRPSLTSNDVYKSMTSKKKFTHKNFQTSRIIAAAINHNLRILRNKIKKLINKKDDVKTSFQGSFTYKSLEDLNKTFWSKKIFFKGIEKIKKKIDKISYISKKHKSEFYLVMYPWGETLEFGQNSFSWENFGHELCFHDKCVFINTFEEFQNEKKNNKYWYSKLYFVGDEHFNNQGNLFLATILEKKIFK